MNLGRKTILGTEFQQKKKKEKDDIVPMYDQYAVGDKYNRVLHGKTWPYRLQGDKRINLNYIFTFVLINTYHLWIDSGSKDEDRSKVSWLTFCH